MRRRWRELDDAIVPAQLPSGNVRKFFYSILLFRVNDPIKWFFPFLFPHHSRFGILTAVALRGCLCLSWKIHAAPYDVNIMFSPLACLRHLPTEIIERRYNTHVNSLLNTKHENAANYFGMQSSIPLERQI